MTPLKAKAMTSFLKKLVIITLLVFVSAWSLDFWEAWVFLVVFFMPQLMMIIYFSRTDPDLLERRLNLPGYETYCQRVKYRLIPNVW